ncbi:hypothetical protein HK100_008865 [Physocladia obscura]|uniref:Nucleotide-diphospho-sugar transferase n=1 Tax=Physocladia obscura TaxID=109957 RepID=A0AAD5XJJ5_9FUNG|nr:hypothetical protein HK100_008865 [Physocladia obscura]
MRKFRSACTLVGAAVLTVCLFFFTTFQSSKRLIDNELIESTISNNDSKISNSNNTVDFELSQLEETIDWDQMQFLDFLNGESESGHKQKARYNPVESWKKIHRYSLLVRPSNYILSIEESEAQNMDIDFLQLARRLRSNLIAYRVLYTEPHLLSRLVQNNFQAANILKNELWSVTSLFEQTIYPWLAPRYNTIRNIIENISNQSDTSSTTTIGIVMSFGQEHLADAILSMTALRKILNCTLPIEIHHVGSTDLPASTTHALRTAFTNTTTVNLLAHFPHELFRFSRWSVKPFAILASRFDIAIFIDADALFLRDPATVISTKTKTSTSVLFFHDRTLEKSDASTAATAAWLARAHPTHLHSAYAHSRMRLLAGRSRHDQESGVMVLDRRRPPVMHALLLSALMNSNRVRDGVYAAVHGDKETFWLAMEMLRVPFTFAPGFAGAVGYRNDLFDDVGGGDYNYDDDGGDRRGDDSQVDSKTDNKFVGRNNDITKIGNGNKRHVRVCGSIFHVDEQLRPFWWNGGVLQMKRMNNEIFMRYEHAAIDLNKNAPDIWEWEDENTPFCMSPTDPAKEVMVLEENHKIIIKKYIEIYKDIKKQGWLTFLNKTH